MEEARAKVISFIGAKRSEEVFFTSGGTESNNIAIKGVAYRNKDRGK
jgi:cysteine desulfurase